MSHPRPDLSNDSDDIYRYIYENLADYKGLIQVRLWGSRSPRKPKEAKPHSDWDLLAVWEEDTIVPSPKLLSVPLNVDLCSVSSEKYSVFRGKEKMSVQVYPEDKHGVFLK